ncbi:MAG: phosphoglycerate dehydrogenase [Xanthomonadales bacterium]|nr:phosphoglycerate dehydrogenase [Xanthomonadales bacterium]
MKVLVTCPPMLGMLAEFIRPAAKKGINLIPATTTQVLSEGELIDLLPQFDGWIIGDDPATRKVFEAGRQGALKAAVKWGVGVDNVDFDACRDLEIPIINTPNMFGGEVADLAIGYMLGLARQSYYIDREIRINNAWPKPPGMSMEGKVIGVVGFGDIGFQTIKRLVGFDVTVQVYDPGVEGSRGLGFVQALTWPEKLAEVDFLIFTCNLNAGNQHMLNADILSRLKPGVKVINVARGPLIDEQALTDALLSGHVSAAALDVFEQEPLPESSRMRGMSQCIFGSHNGSNTTEGVRRASKEAINKIAGFLNAEK